jgi:hypothetical protein
LLFPVVALTRVPAKKNPPPDANGGRRSSSGLNQQNGGRRVEVRRKYCFLINTSRGHTCNFIPSKVVLTIRRIAHSCGGFSPTLLMVLHIKIPPRI